MSRADSCLQPPGRHRGPFIAIIVPDMFSYRTHQKGRL